MTLVPSGHNRRLSTSASRHSSMQSGSLHSLRGRYFADFNVVMWKLIFELQACSQRVLKASMTRIKSAVDLQDVVVLRKVRITRDSVLHRISITCTHFSARPKDLVDTR
jgi:hypothetical protein